MSIDYEQDLRERWLPSDEQMAQADALLTIGLDKERGEDRERGVYTTHLLIGKEYGWWGDGIKVVHLDGVFTTRQAALDFLVMVAKKRHDEGGEKLTGGYAWHPRVGEAGVFEDIMSEFPGRGS